MIVSPTTTAKFHAFLQSAHDIMIREKNVQQDEHVLDAVMLLLLLRDPAFEYDLW